LQRHPDPCPERPGGLRRARRGVLHPLRLVEDRRFPLDRREARRVPDEHAVARDHDAPRREALEQRGAARPLVAHGREPRREGARLLDPRPDDRGRRDHERRSARQVFRRGREEGERHVRLAEPHLVGEHAAEAGCAQRPEPVEARPLIGAERAAVAGRGRGGSDRSPCCQRGERRSGGGARLFEHIARLTRPRPDVRRDREAHAAAEGARSGCAQRVEQGAAGRADEVVALAEPRRAGRLEHPPERDLVRADEVASVEVEPAARNVREREPRPRRLVEHAAPGDARGGTEERAGAEARERRGDLVAFDHARCMGRMERAVRGRDGLEETPRSARVAAEAALFGGLGRGVGEGQDAARRRIEPARGDDEPPLSVIVGGDHRGEELVLGGGGRRGGGRPGRGGAPVGPGRLGREPGGPGFAEYAAERRERLVERARRVRPLGGTGGGRRIRPRRRCATGEDLGDIERHRALPGE
jgi:hypothetical protein